MREVLKDKGKEKAKSKWKRRMTRVGVDVAESKAWKLTRQVMRIHISTVSFSLPLDPITTDDVGGL